MKLYAVIKDSVRNSPLVIAVKEDEIVSVHGINEYGKALASQIVNAGSIGNDSLPDGIEITEFKSISPGAESIFASYRDSSPLNFKSMETAISEEFKNKIKGKFFNERKIFTPKDKKLTHSGTQIRKFKDPMTKTNIVTFKAREFKGRVRKSSVITSVMAYGIGFDSSRNSIFQKESKRITDHSVNKINSFVGDGVMRRFARKTMSSELNGKRLTRRSNALSRKIIDIDSKSLSNQHRYTFSIEARFKRMS